MSLKEEFNKLVDAVKTQSATKGKKLRNEDIATLLGFNRSYFSSLLGSRGVVSQDHIEALIKHFPFLAEPNGKKKSKLDIRNLRLQWKLTIKEFSDITGISKSKLIDWESDISEPDPYDALLLKMVQERLEKMQDDLLSFQENLSVLGNIKYGIELQKYLDANNVTKAQFASRVGVDEVFVNLTLKGLFTWEEPSYFPIWRSTGIKENRKEESTAILKLRTPYPHLNESYLTDISNKSLQFLPDILFVPIAQWSNYVEQYSNTQFLQNLEHFELPPNTLSAGIVWRYFEIAKNSILVNSSENDIGLFSLVHFEDWFLLIEFSVYLIVLSNSLILAKATAYKEVDKIVLYEHANTKTESRTINMSEIKEIWELKKILTNPKFLTESAEVEGFQKKRDEVLKRLKTQNKESS